jgi:hypothetical protein
MGLQRLPGRPPVRSGSPTLQGSEIRTRSRALAPQGHRKATTQNPPRRHRSHATLERSRCPARSPRNRSWPQGCDRPSKRLTRGSVAQQVSGSTEAFQALWSQGADVVLIGAAGSHQKGWHAVSERLSWAAEDLNWGGFHSENLLTSISEDLAGRSGEHEWRG